VTARDAYDPFGKRRFANGNYDAAGALVVDWSPAVNSGTDRGFTGHEQLDDIGLTHMNGRMYDASIGRFLSVDRAVTQPYELQSYNRYSYVENRPLNSTDPSGWNPLTQDKWSLPRPLPDPEQHPSQPLPLPKPQEMKEVKITGNGAVNPGCTGACLTVLRAEIDKYNKRMLAGGYVRSLMGGSLVMQRPKPVVVRLPSLTPLQLYALLAGETLVLVQEATEIPGSNTMAGPYAFLQAAEGLSTGANSASLPPSGPDGEDENEKKSQRKIERLHSKDTILKDNPDGYKYWSGRPTKEIVDSLSPSRTGPNDEPLMVNERGRIIQGNTRALVLEERGFDINSLPRIRY
jgi:RHS repeat-associated protein